MYFFLCYFSFLFTHYSECNSLVVGLNLKQLLESGRISIHFLILFFLFFRLWLWKTGTIFKQSYYTPLQLILESFTLSVGFSSEIGFLWAWFKPFCSMALMRIHLLKEHKSNQAQQQRLQQWHFRSLHHLTRQNQQMRLLQGSSRIRMHLCLCSILQVWSE